MHRLSSEFLEQCSSSFRLFSILSGSQNTWRLSAVQPRRLVCKIKKSLNHLYIMETSALPSKLRFVGAKKNPLNHLHEIQENSFHCDFEEIKSDFCYLVAAIIRQYQGRLNLRGCFTFECLLLDVKLLDSPCLSSYAL